MALKKLTLKPGVNRENTRYTNEGGYYESDMVRFRQGTPEKVGGWARISANTFLGVCRSLWNWVTLTAQNLMGVGTNLKYYIENGGAYYDITPVRAEVTLTNPFTTVASSKIVTVSDISGGYINGAFVTYTGATAVGGITISGEYQITYIAGSSTYTITAATAATSGATGGGTVYAVYQVNPGPAYAVPLTGWGSGTWGSGTWGNSASAADSLRIWNANNFGQDLLYGPRGGPLYYWPASVGVSASTLSITIASPAVVTAAATLPDATAIQLQTTGALPTGLTVGTTYYTKYLTTNTFNLSLTPGGAAINTSGTQSGAASISPRGLLVSSLNGAHYVPLYQNYFLISDASRFVIVFGTNDYNSTTLDPMLIRWSDQESTVEWYPSATNQAGSLRLSHGSKIVTALQSRQEIVVWTDSSFYSIQYLGAPIVWGSQLLADNVSIASSNAMAVAANVVYWMGVDKFYKYDGKVATLRCDLRQFIYSDINPVQFDQVYCSTNEGFNEVWWFYCTETSTVINRYVVYNYVEDVWYYGSMARTAWIDTGLRNYPVAATYANNLVSQEFGVDDGTGADLVAMNSFITTSQFDIDDGNNFAFIWRMLPDLTFRGSTEGTTPSLTMQLQPLKNSGSGYNDPKSVGGTSADATQAVVATSTYPLTADQLDKYNGQVNIRVRGRQMSMKISCNTLGTQWQLGSPRIDIRPDGRR